MTKKILNTPTGHSSRSTARPGSRSSRAGASRLVDRFAEVRAANIEELLPWSATRSEPSVIRRRRDTESAARHLRSTT
jgi:hypothetical protein